MPPPALKSQLSNDIHTVNQFIDMAGKDHILSAQNNGKVSVRNSLWNRFISFISPHLAKRENQRTAQVFKEKLLAVAGAFEYQKGRNGYHAEDIFYHFSGFEERDRKSAVETILNSGILNEEFAGTKALTGRKVQEVLEQIDSKGLEFATQKRSEIFTQVREGLDLYRASRASFQAADFNPNKLEGSDLDALLGSIQGLHNMSLKIKSVIDNIRQDLQTANELEDVELSLHLFRELKLAQALSSESDLFDVEVKASKIVRKYFDPHMAKFEEAIEHIDAITLNFANLNDEEIKARDDLISLVNKFDTAIGRLSNLLESANTHIDQGDEYNHDQLQKWLEFRSNIQEKIDHIKAIRARAVHAGVTTLTPLGNIKRIDARNEETHIAPTSIVTKEELDGIAKEIARLEEAQKNPSVAAPQTKGILKRRVSPEAI